MVQEWRDAPEGDVVARGEEPDLLCDGHAVVDALQLADLLAAEGVDVDAGEVTLFSVGRPFRSGAA